MCIRELRSPSLSPVLFGCKQDDTAMFFFSSQKTRMHPPPPHPPRLGRGRGSGMTSPATPNSLWVATAVAPLPLLVPPGGSAVVAAQRGAGRPPPVRPPGPGLGPHPRPCPHRPLPLPAGGPLRPILSTPKLTEPPRQFWSWDFLLVFCTLLNCGIHAAPSPKPTPPPKQALPSSRCHL